ncbi:IDEAL domain-containing protein [uncultured Metabacillus sp.]|uniref:IDEAL domain-containing protein n=1 Tax=uncultured Metabacillus sp. TaxID=2860135 RepID=UPI0026342377|nr:IDEAL domain-containing protein [uncultured Metabacillus sp.]
MDKNSLNTVNKQTKEMFDALAAELIVDKAIRDFQKEQLRKGIDQSLQERNREEFLRLTKALNELH